MKFALRMYGEHIIATAATFILLAPLVLIQKDNSTFVTVIGIVQLLFYWFIVGNYFVKRGKKDAKNNETSLKSIVLSSLAFIIPDIVMCILFWICGNYDVITSISVILFTYWNFAYSNIMFTVGSFPWSGLLVTVSYIPLFLLMYYMGILRKKKDDAVISSKDADKLLGE